MRKVLQFRLGIPEWNSLVQSQFQISTRSLPRTLRWLPIHCEPGSGTIISSSRTTRPRTEKARTGFGAPCCGEMMK